MSSNIRNAVIFIAIILILLFLAKGCQNGENPVSDLGEAASEAVSETVDAAKDAGDAIAEAGSSVTSGAGDLLEKLGEFFSVSLPNGVELSIPEFGVENQLINFIESEAEVDKETWFNFDRINFDTGSINLSESSNEQIGNIAAVLDAYENLELKIGGYTDNTGSDAVNMRLSQARADTVKRALVREGIDEERLTTEGYGSAHAAASNDTEEGRAENRRIALRVTAK